MFLAGGGEFCLTFWSASHIRLHFDAPAWAGGLGVAVFALAMVIGQVASGYRIPQKRRRHLVVFAAILGAAISLSLPFIQSLPLFFAVLFLTGLATAPFWPSIQSDAASEMPRLDSTMLLILLSCAGVPGCGIFTYLVGFIVNQTASLNAAFLIVPFAYGLIAILLITDRHSPP